MKYIINFLRYKAYRQYEIKCSPNPKSNHYEHISAIIITIPNWAVMKYVNPYKKLALINPVRTSLINIIN